MNVSSKIGILATLLLVNANLFAQETPFSLGICLGGGMSVNIGIDKILVPEDYYSNYNFKDKWQLTPIVGIFAQYHVDGSIIGIEGGFNYWQKASQLVYNDTKELNYKVTPRYNYIGVSALLKMYPWRKGFNISIGGRAGANLNGKGISYESNQEESKFANYHFATVDETERLMREKLTGQPDIAVGGGLGYEIGKHWNIDLRYFYGLNSTIKTERNDYNWAEYSTHGQNIELSISYLFKL